MACADDKEQHADGHDADKDGGAPAAPHEVTEAAPLLLGREQTCGSHSLGGDPTALGGNEGIFRLQDHAIGQGVQGGEGVQGAVQILFHT